MAAYLDSIAQGKGSLLFRTVIALIPAHDILFGRISEPHSIHGDRGVVMSMPQNIVLSPRRLDMIYSTFAAHRRTQRPRRP